VGWVKGEVRGSGWKSAAAARVMGADARSRSRNRRRRGERRRGDAGEDRRRRPYRRKDQSLGAGKAGRTAAWAPKRGKRVGGWDELGRGGEPRGRRQERSRTA